MEEKRTPVERNMDRRLVERNLRKGIISQADIDAFEGKLKDVEDNLEVVTIDSDEEQEEQASKQPETTAAGSEGARASTAASVSSFTNSQGGA